MFVWCSPPTIALIQGVAQYKFLESYRHITKAAYQDTSSVKTLAVISLNSVWEIRKSYTSSLVNSTLLKKETLLWTPSHSHVLVDSGVCDRSREIVIVLEDGTIISAITSEILWIKYFANRSFLDPRLKRTKPAPIKRGTIMWTRTREMPGIARASPKGSTSQGKTV